MSITHKTLDEYILRSYIMPNPIFRHGIDEKMKRYINIYDKKFE